jgi:hypothetical protein
VVIDENKKSWGKTRSRVNEMMARNVESRENQKGIFLLRMATSSLLGPLALGANKGHPA